VGEENKEEERKKRKKGEEEQERKKGEEEQERKKEVEVERGGDENGGGERLKQIQQVSIQASTILPPRTILPPASF